MPATFNGSLVTSAFIGRLLAPLPDGASPLLDVEFKRDLRKARKTALFAAYWQALAAAHRSAAAGMEAAIARVLGKARETRIELNSAAKLADHEMIDAVDAYVRLPVQSAYEANKRARNLRQMLRNNRSTLLMRALHEDWLPHLEAYGAKPME